MNKGFDYWSSGKGISSFVKIYWLIYIIFYLAGVWLSILARNPFAFLFIGFLPYIWIRIYRTIHNPIHDLKKSVENIAPGLSQSILQQRLKSNIKKDVVDQKQQAGLLYAGLLLVNKDDMDQRILSYIRNNKKINWNSMVSLSLWFFTFLIFLFVLYIMR